MSRIWQNGLRPSNLNQGDNNNNVNIVTDAQKGKNGFVEKMHVIFWDMKTTTKRWQKKAKMTYKWRPRLELVLFFRHQQT